MLVPLVLLSLACASPADLARDELGSGECADKAEDKCEDDLAGADRLACLKRETYLCEELEKASAP
ncbi:MAG: hypothetical protein ACREJT_08160 [Myxococcota bacterium]